MFSFRTLASKRRCVEMSRQLGKFVLHGEGNVSCRSFRDSHRFWIKRSGCNLGTLNIKDLVECQALTNNMNDINASLECPLHSSLYLLTSCEFVAHIHPEFVVSIMCSEQSEDFASLRLFPDQVVRTGISTPVLKYAHPGEELGNAAMELIPTYWQKSDSHGVILMKNHGATIFGSSIKNIVLTAAMLEKSASIFVKSSCMGIAPLTLRNCLDIIDDPKEKIRAIV